MFTGSNAQSSLYFIPAEEAFHIDRPDLVSDRATRQLSSESAPHTLLTLVDDDGQEKEEKLEMLAYLDGSVLEVFINKRTVITTRVYLNTPGCGYLSFWAESDVITDGLEPGAVLTSCFVWDGLATIENLEGQ